MEGGLGGKGLLGIEGRGVMGHCEGGPDLCLAAPIQSTARLPPHSRTQPLRLRQEDCLLPPPALGPRPVCEGRATWDTPSGICSGPARTLVQISWTITGLREARSRPPSVASSHTPLCTLLHTNVCCLHSTYFPGKAGTQEHPEHLNMIKAPREALL